MCGRVAEEVAERQQPQNGQNPEPSYQAFDIAKGVVGILVVPRNSSHDECMYRRWLQSVRRRRSQR